MMAATPTYEQSEHRPLTQCAWRLAAVVGLHAGLIACAMHMQTKTTPEPAPFRMEVRTIETPSSSPAVPKSVTAPPKRLPAIAQPVKRRSQPPAQAPVLAAASGAEPAPSEFTSSPAAAAPAKELASAQAPLIPAPVAAPVQGPRFDADYLQNPPPAYPSLSRRMREEGKVLLQVRVSTAGLPEQIQVTHGSGYPRLDEAAVNTVQRWRFVPARHGDETISASVIVPIVFRLEG
jgi:protein TonB